MKNKHLIRTLILIVIAVFLSTFVKIPFYVTKPGMATSLKQMVQVENGHHEEGSIYLTTVKITRANPFTYLWAHTQKYYEVFPDEQVKYDGESDEQYIERQIHIMEASQQAAIVVAYKKANKQITYKNNGIMVMQTIEKMPAAKKLKVGDRITHVDGKFIETEEDFIHYVQSKNEGDVITITLQRDGKERKTKIQLAPFPNEPEKIGVGISIMTDKEIMTTPSVELDTKSIGGPSAGLMMALEIYNQLTEEDITKGHKIAGTGTINENGDVGVIGGISQKVVAADKEGIEIFFAPKEGGNYDKAIKTAKEIKSDMKIIPVETFDDAVNYLQTLN